MLTIKNLHAQFEGNPILQGVDLAVSPGEIHVILGPNGSGKSTLGRVILGDETYEKTAGSIEFLGEDFLAKSIEERARAGFFLSFQSPPALDGVSVRSFLFAAKKAQQPDFSSSFRFKKNLEQNLETLRLGRDFSDREINKGFSGGERKKIEMASMLMLDPSLVFLDEIDSGVDVDTVNAIARVFDAWFSGTKSEEKTPGKSAIIVSHSEKLLEKIRPTHVHIFCHGRIIRSGGSEMIERVHLEGFDAYLKKPSNPPASLRVVRG
jgi:Fe-S cluster assembly ATP-binding protein